MLDGECLVHDKEKFFLFWGKKAIFFQKMVAPSKKPYSPKYVYWYQCFDAKSLVHGRPPSCPNVFTIP